MVSKQIYLNHKFDPSRIYRFREEWKILTDNTTILKHQNNKQKLQILEALYIRNLQPAPNRINFQTSANVLKFL